jgi:hypothetical protein
MRKIIKKKLTAIFILVFLIIWSNLSIGQENIAIASCCNEVSGRCTGSSYCSACTNCSRCKHCNSGGSCGVCSGASITTNNNNYSNSSKKRNPVSNNINKKTYSTDNVDTLEIDYLPNDTYSEYYLKTFIVSIQTLNLRKGPGTNYGIMEKLSKYQELIFLAITGNWIKVLVKSTKSIGFVYYEYISILTE